MDRVAVQRLLKSVYEKYKYVALIVLLGISLMLIPQTKEAKSNSIPNTEDSAEITDELVQILSQIDGVGKVDVMITESEGTQTHYQTDEDLDESEGEKRIRYDTVIVSRDGDDMGLVRSVTPPVYLGAIVVCQGGGNPAVRLDVTNAVAAVTGISTDRIKILKMK